MDSRDKSTLANVVGWIALVLSVIALVLAWMAYNNASDENLEQRIQDQIQNTIPTFQQDTGGMDSDLNSNSMNSTTDDEAVTPGVDDGTVDNDAPVDGEDATRPEADTNTAQ